MSETNQLINKVKEYTAGKNLSSDTVNSWLTSLITTIESLQKQNGNLKESWDEQKEEIRSMRHALSMANEKNGGDYYAWMPFEENHLETLSCPVLIEADWIRQLIDSETKSLKVQIESQKEALKGATDISHIAGSKIKELESTVKSQKEEIEILKSWEVKLQDAHRFELFSLKLDIKSQKAITELAVDGFKKISERAATYRYASVGGMADKALSEIERLSHEQNS